MASIIVATDTCAPLRTINLESGEYTAVVRHELVEPQEASFDVTLITDTELLLISFNYLEPERVLLNIRTLLAQQ